MMTTAERAASLAQAAKAFPFLGQISAEDLRQLLVTELGHVEALDRFVPRGSHLARAIAPKTILHIVAGNTPAAALQSLIRGLLLGAHNLVKLPSEGLPEVDRFVQQIGEILARQIELAPQLPSHWLDQAEAVVVFGSDETIAEIRAQIRPDQIFIPHGHRVSFGVIFADPDFSSVDAAALDVSTFDQLGCLSPHVFFVRDEPYGYAERLAKALAQRESLDPRSSVSVSVSNSIRALREEISFRAACGESCALWQSPESTAWTVIYDEAGGFPSTPLHRTVFVKPVPEDLPAVLSPVRSHLSCAGIHPVSGEFAAELSRCGVTRICPLGKMQLPPLSWTQDGGLPLAPLLRWATLEQDS